MRLWYINLEVKNNRRKTSKRKSLIKRLLSYRFLLSVPGRFGLFYPQSFRKCSFSSVVPKTSTNNLLMFLFVSVSASLPLYLSMSSISVSLSLLVELFLWTLFLPFMLWHCFEISLTVSKRLAKCNLFSNQFISGQKYFSGKMG